MLFSVLNNSTEAGVIRVIAGLSHQAMEARDSLVPVGQRLPEQAAFTPGDISLHL